MTLPLLWMTSCAPSSPLALVPLALDRAMGLPPVLIGSTSPSPDPVLARDLLLRESWVAYRQRFIQGDGRVIDWEAQARTVSEGQAYALLRAVLADDPETFARTLDWAETNLRRSPPSSGPLPAELLHAVPEGGDRLWAWHWGQRLDGTWGVLDYNFASDADIDGITALILAARRWQRPDYLDLARLKLDDLWAQATVALPTNDSRYLLPGPLAVFQPQPGAIYLNPSYLAPYAFRLFAQVDPSHDWLSLVESSYAVLEQYSQLSTPRLPSDWVVLNLVDQTLELPSESSPLASRYGFDAYRVWWRLAWDAIWFKEPRAQALLAEKLSFLTDLWQQQGRIPARLSLDGQPLVDYEATPQYAMLYPALRLVAPEIAAAIYEQKLVTAYSHGIWDNADAYYVQNLAWLGLYPVQRVPVHWLQP
jgi:endoglucanase